MRIVSYEEKYRQDIRQIAVQCGSPDNFVNPEHRRFTELMYCDEYLDHETCFVLLDEDKPAGYILCAENIDRFMENMKPYIREIEEQCPHFAYRLDFRAYQAYAEQYPAHLHIDILEEYTGGGNGRKLMLTLYKHLAENQVKGLMLGVDRNNVRACKYYEAMGFRCLKQADSSMWMGITRAEMQNRI